MERKEIEEMVIGIAQKSLGKESSELSMEKTWKEDLGAKSTNIMKILALTSMRSGVEMTPEELAACATLGELADFIEKNQS